MRLLASRTTRCRTTNAAGAPQSTGKSLPADYRSVADCCQCHQYEHACLCLRIARKSAFYSIRSPTWTLRHSRVDSSHSIAEQTAPEAVLIFSYVIETVGSTAT